MRWARLLLAGLVGIALHLATGVAGAPTASAAACGPAPAGQVAVVVVIDTGSGAPWQRCMTLEERASGLDALRATGVQLRVGPGGFVCAIGGTPASGCATDDPSLPGWSYWHASPGGSWTYSQVGAGGYRLPKRCAVEGWSFGPPSPKRPPRVSPPAVTCEAPRPAPTPTEPPATTLAGGGGGSSGAASGGGSGGAVTGGGTSGGGGAPPVDSPGDASTSTTAPTSDAASEPDRPGSDDTAEDSSEERAESDGERAVARSEPPAQLEMADAPGRSGGGGSWVPTAVVLLVVAGIGGGAVLRSRRR